MSAPTHIEVYVNAMTRTPDGSRLAERGDPVHFYDVEARQVETDPLHRDWTGEIVVLDEVENIKSYDDAVATARNLCVKHGLEPFDWEDVGG